MCSRSSNVNPCGVRPPPVGRRRSCSINPLRKRGEEDKKKKKKKKERKIYIFDSCCYRGLLSVARPSFFLSLVFVTFWLCIHTLLLAGQTVAPWVSILKHAISTSSLSSSLNLNVTIFTWSFIGIEWLSKKKDPDNRLKLDFSILKMSLV